MDFCRLFSRIQRFFRTIICIILLLSANQIYASGDFVPDPATPDAVLAPPTPTKDPLEKFNRGIFAFNDFIDMIILKPIATLYNKIMPKPLNAGIHNVFDNINNIPTIGNDILQFHLYQSFNDTWRLIINSTIGIGGLFDVAERMGLPPYSNDFGLTLSRYGWKQSTYIVLPFFGPNTFRDTIEIPVDFYAFSIYPYIHSDRVAWGIFGLNVIDKRAQLLKVESVLDAAALDRYSFIRSAYLQRRAFQIQQNDRLTFLAPPPGRAEEDPSKNITNSKLEMRSS